MEINKEEFKNNLNESRNKFKNKYNLTNDSFIGNIDHDKKINRFIETIIENQYVIFKTTRMVGMTTMFAILSSTCKNVEILYIGVNHASCKWFTNKILNDYKYVRTCTGKNIGAIKNTDIIIIDNAVFHKNLKMILNYIIENCNDKCKIIISSTPDEPKGDFHDLYIDSINKNNKFKAVDFSDLINKSNLSEFKEIYGNREDYFKREVLGEFADDIFDESKSSLIPSVRIETDIYKEIKDKIGNMKISEYIRNLIYMDLKK